MSKKTWITLLSVLLKILSFVIDQLKEQQDQQVTASSLEDTNMTKLSQIVADIQEQVDNIAK